MFQTLITNLTFGNIIPWLLLGIVAAFIVHLIDQKEVHKELWITTIAGVVGALIGGLITSLFIAVDPSGINTSSFVMAILVGLLFSLVERIVTLSRQKPIDADEQRYDYESGRVAYYSQVAPLTEAEKRQYQTQPTYVPKEKHAVKPAELEKYLAGISFPVSREELINHAELLDANEDILYTLEQLPDKQFFGPISLSEQLQQIS